MKSHLRPGRALTRNRQPTVPSEWRSVDTDDAQGVYVTAMDALNLPIGPLGDWHGTMWRPAAGTGASTRTPTTEALCRIGNALWGREGLVDAREALRLIGHPAGVAASPVWAASHPRAVAEMVVKALRDSGWITNPDPQSARRWLSADGRSRCARLLGEARGSMERERRALDEWIEATCAMRGLTRADA